MTKKKPTIPGVKNGIITLRNGGTVEFSKRRYGTVVVFDGSTLMSLETFVREAVDIAVMSGRYTVNAALEWLGFPDDGTCPLCDGPDRTACPHCSIGRCPRCAVTHDRSALCDETAFYAESHRLFRNGDAIEAQDTYFARKHMANVYLRRKEQ